MAILTNNHQLIQNGSTVVGTGEFIPVKNAESLVISVYGTATFTILFQGALDDGNYFTLSGTSLADPTVFASSTSVLGAWEFDVSALNTFKANLTAVSGGSITVSTSIPR